MSGATLSVKELTTGYFGKKVIEGLSFSIDEPAVYIVLGPNGAGKTTLLRAIAGILRPYSGSIEVNGRPVNEMRGHMGYLTHLDGLPEGMKVIEALDFYARIEGASGNDLDRVCNTLSIGELRGKRLSQLSQGQRKRVSVARIFLSYKDIYLLDEPTSNLDPKVASEIRSLVLGLSRDRIVLYSSHNLFEVREIGTYIIAIKNGRLALYNRISDIKTENYSIGVRTLGEEPPGYLKREGEYYIFALAGPEKVQGLIGDLLSKGIRIREIREMQNPLEEIFQ